MRAALLALTVLALGAGCSEPDVLTFVLVHDPTLDPATDFASARVRIYDLGDVAVAGDEMQTFAETAPTADALSGVSSAALRMLTVGHTYIAVLSFEATSGCRAPTQVVGRSLAFEHRNGSYDVPVQVGCAGEITPTRRPLRIGRAFGTTTATADGAVVAGGLTSIDEAGVIGPPVMTVERYDLSTGSFDDVSVVSTNRTNAGSVLLVSGEVALLGGATEDGTCQTTTEIVYPAPRPGVDLDVARCGPAAALLDAGQVLVVGGDAGLIPRNVIFDAAMTSVVEILEPGSAVYRQLPQVLPIGPAAIVLDGAGDGASAVEVVAPGCTATGGPCFYPVAIDPMDDPGPTWSGARGVVLPCVEGSAIATGVLYVFGGQVVAGPGDPPTPVDGAFCTEITADVAEWQLARVPLPVPLTRTSHQVVAVEHHAGPRILVVGGSEPGSDLAYSDALVVDVRACSCAILGAEIRPALLGGALLGHAVTPLADGTVLVTGGIGANPATGGIIALPYAGLYFPDTETD